MGLSAEKLREDLDALSLREPKVASALERVGYPEPRLRERGFVTMLRTIVGQQVSVAAAASMWRKLEAELGEGFTPACLLERDFDTLRACGLSRQKQGYARSLCELVAAGTPSPQTTRRRLPSSPASRASGVGRRKSICCLPKAAAISGRRATLPCRRG